MKEKINVVDLGCWPNASVILPAAKNFKKNGGEWLDFFWIEKEPFDLSLNFLTEEEKIWFQKIWWTYQNLKMLSSSIWLDLEEDWVRNFFILSLPRNREACLLACRGQVSPKGASTTDSLLTEIFSLKNNIWILLITEVRQYRNYLNQRIKELFWEASSFELFDWLDQKGYNKTLDFWEIKVRVVDSESNYSDFPGVLNYDISKSTYLEKIQLPSVYWLKF